MEQKIEQGQEVTLLSNQGVIKRLVVEDLGEVLLVCLPEEYARARREGRKPMAVGFKRSDLIPDPA
jgi:hypothetical protein